MSGGEKAGEKSPATSGRRGRKIRKAAMPLAPGAITPEDIANAFDVAMVQRPEQEQIGRLAAIFSNYKAYFLDAEKERERNRLAADAGAAIRTLTATLPKLLEYHQGHEQHGDPFAEWQARAVRDLLTAVTAADLPRIEAQSNVPGVVRDWRWLVDVIHPVVRDAFPPGTGTAKGGPVSRFLAAILPKVSGDAPTPDAIATQIIKSPGRTGEK